MAETNKNFRVKNGLEVGGNGIFDGTVTSSLLSTASATITSVSDSVVPLTVTGATGQTANLLEIKDSSANNLVVASASGDLRTSVSGSSTTTPRILGLGTGSFLSGQAARFQFADQFNSIQTSFEGRTRISAYWGLELSGRSTSAPTFVTGTTSDPGVSVLNSLAATVAMVIKGATSQSADLLQIQNSANSVLMQIKSNGTLVVPGFQTGSLSFSGITWNGYSNPTGVTTLPTVVVKGISSQSSNLQEWQDSTGSIKARVRNDGYLYGAGVFALDSSIGIEAGGFNMQRRTTAASNPGASRAIISFRDGTTSGTLRLTVRSGASGEEQTLFDNIPQTSGTTTVTIHGGTP